MSRKHVITTLSDFSLKYQRKLRKRIENLSHPDIFTKNIDQCIIWKGGLMQKDDPTSYGLITLQETKRNGKMVRRTASVHRITYMLSYGDIPADHDADHAPCCGNNKACCNPMHITPIHHVKNGYYRNTTNLGKRFTDAEKIEQYYNIRNGMTKQAFVTHYGTPHERYSALNSHRNEPEFYDRVLVSFNAGLSEADALKDIVAWKATRGKRFNWTVKADRFIWDNLKNDRSSAEILKDFVPIFGAVGKAALYTRVSNYNTGNGSETVKRRIAEFEANP